ncbi:MULTISPECIES: porin family protein [unclassified Lacinutrix]
MKKIILSLALLIAGTTAFSQVTLKPGVRAGANFANVSNLKTDQKTDFYIGAFLEMQLADFYALQPEVTYSRQGAKYDISGVDDLDLQYVGLTVINKFSPIKNLGLHFLVGPGIDVKVSDNVQSNYRYDSYYDPYYNSYDTAPIDITFTGGIGYDFPFGLSVEARYKQGIIDYDDGFSEFGDSGSGDYYYDDERDDNNLNGVFQIGVSYKFDFSN